MKMSCAVIFLICVCFHTGFGQKFQTAAKLYTNFSYFNTDPIPILYDYEERNFRFKGITPAFHLFNQDRQSYHELEFSNLTFKTHERQLENVKEALVGLRYEYGKATQFNLRIEHLQFLLGGSARSFYYRKNITPNISNRFGETDSEFKVVLGVVPRLRYKLNEQFSLDLNTVISAFSIGTERRYFDNPILLSEESRTQKSFNTDFVFPSNFILRLGVIYNL